MSEDILKGAHTPAQPEVSAMLPEAMRALTEFFGANYAVTLFVAEKAVPVGQTRPAHFSYISTESQQNMLATLKSFLNKMREWGPKVDKIHDKPPTDTAQ